MKTLPLKLIIVICCFVNSCQFNEGQQIDIASLRLKAKEAKTFCIAKGLETNFCILIDLSRHSGLKRFFIWDFNTGTIADSFLVSHGCGNNPWGGDYTKERATVSNKDGSHLSSVGKYIIGNRGFSNWGININYKLHGQEPTNSNAYVRQIVLHSWVKVTDEEVYPDGTPEGWGCPAISNASMRIVDSKLRNTNKKVLLWIFQ